VAVTLNLYLAIGLMAIMNEPLRLCMWTFARRWITHICLLKTVHGRSYTSTTNNITTLPNFEIISTNWS